MAFAFALFAATFRATYSAAVRPIINMGDGLAQRQRLKAVEWGRERAPSAALVLILIKLMLCCSLCSKVDGQLSPLVLEEVIEHGPLFDEFEDEAWWSGVDIVDTALRPWPITVAEASLQAMGLNSLNPLQPTSRDAEEYFCSVFTTDLKAPCPAVAIAGIDPSTDFSSSPSLFPIPSSPSSTFSVSSSSDSSPSDTSYGSLSSASSLSSSFPAPQSLQFVPRPPPPPPVPPFMTDFVKLLHQQLDHSNEECLLCQWAQLNATVDLVANSEPSTENTWIPMLVVVALVSAMLGATLMIAALKCRRFKVLPRGGSCPTLPVGYMVGEGKDGVQSTEMTGLDSLPKTLNTNADGTPSNINRPRLDTPTLNAPPTAAVAGSKSSADEATGWRIRLWRKMTSSNRSPSQMLDDYRCREEPYVALPGDGDAISAVYAELNSVTGSIHRPGLDSMSAYPPYHLNTYSEIHEPRVLSLAPPPYAHSASSTVHHAHPHSHPHHHTLHLQRMLSDGTYENAGYAMERGLVLLEHHNNESGSGCASTPSSAYYSDLSNSDRSAGSHPPQLWGRPGKERSNSSSQRSSQSLPHCCHGQLHQHHSEPVRARDLMPVALQVIPDNQQIPDASAVAALPLGHGHGDDTGTTTCCSRNPAMDSKAVAYFSRGGNSASLNHTSKRPLPPLPSRQLQRPQRRYAYAVNHAHMSTLNHLSQLSTLSLASETSSILPSGIDCPLACVPSEYV